MEELLRRRRHLHRRNRQDIVALPKGYSGTIKVIKPQSRFHESTAILSYDLDETETVFGQTLHARYHGTDTWLYRNNRWQIIAGQELRYYEDPAVGKIDTTRLDEFVGTYELSPGVTLTVSREGDQLYSQRGTTPKSLLQPESPDLFFRPGAEGRRLFRRNEAGKIDHSSTAATMKTSSGKNSRALFKRLNPRHRFPQRDQQDDRLDWDRRQTREI